MEMEVQLQQVGTSSQLQGTEDEALSQVMQPSPREVQQPPSYTAKQQEMAYPQWPQTPQVMVRNKISLKSKYKHKQIYRKKNTENHAKPILLKFNAHVDH